MKITSAHVYKAALRIPAVASLLICFSTDIIGHPPSLLIPQDHKDAESKGAFLDFSDHLGQYEKLRKQVEETLPKLKPTDKPEVILAHEQELAHRISDARKDAKPGDIFTHEIREEFRKEIRRVFAGPSGQQLRKTIYQGEPVNLELRVNQIYPATVPVTTVPPTLLQNLPKLPADLEYGIVGSDFVLLDAKTRLAIDFIHEAIPKPTK